MHINLSPRILQKRKKIIKDIFNLFFFFFFFGSPIQFLTSGAGSKAWRGDLKNMNRQGLKFFYDGQGFMSVKLAQTDVEIAFYDVFGRVIHGLAITKQLHSAIWSQEFKAYFLLLFCWETFGRKYSSFSEASADYIAILIFLFSLI